MATLPPQPSWAATHSGGEGAHRQLWCPRSLVRAVTKTICRWRLGYSDLHSWLIFAPFYPSRRSRIPLRKIRQYYFIDVKTIKFFCHHLFLRSKHPGQPLHQYSWAQPSVQRTVKSGGPTRELGTEAQAMGGASGDSTLPGFGHPPAGTHGLGPGTKEEQWPTRGLGTEAQATGAEPAQHTYNPALLPRTCRTPRRQAPTTAHARFRAGNGEERGRTQHARNPATLPLSNPQPHRYSPPPQSGAHGHVTS